MEKHVDRIKFMSDADTGELSVSEMSMQYYQAHDSCDDEVRDQVLTIKTADAGGGTYFIIETERWAFDNKEELIKIIDDFISRL